MKTKLLIGAFILLTSAVYAENIKPLAKVDNYSGIYVFSKCEPVAEYETLGDVSVSSGGGSYYSIGGMTFYSSSSLQYNELRNALIIAAVMANRDVDGVLIYPSSAGCGRATMIKFKEGTPNSQKELATVHSVRNMYVFIDSKPAGDYDYRAKHKYHGMDSRFSKMVENLVQNTKNLTKSADAVIVHFVTGGYDYVEAINLRER